MGEVIETSKLLGLDNMVKKFPKGYETRPSNNLNNFSSGEAKLICVARAIISNLRY